MQINREKAKKIKEIFKLEYIIMLGDKNFHMQNDNECIAYGMRTASSLDGSWMNPAKKYLLVISKNGNHRKMNFQKNHITDSEISKINKILRSKALTLNNENI